MPAAAIDIDDEEHQMLDGLGVLDATSLVLTHSRERGVANFEAGMYFRGPRRGLAAWLADPAAMGSLDFVSPQASIAAAVVAKDGGVMFDELLDALASAAPEAIQELRRFEQEVGVREAPVVKHDQKKAVGAGGPELTGHAHSIPL